MCLCFLYCFVLCIMSFFVVCVTFFSLGLALLSFSYCFVCLYIFFSSCFVVLFIFLLFSFCLLFFFFFFSYPTPPLFTPPPPTDVFPFFCMFSLCFVLSGCVVLLYLVVSGSHHSSLIYPLSSFIFYFSLLFLCFVHIFFRCSPLHFPFLLSLLQLISFLVAFSVLVCRLILLLFSC